MKLNLLPLHGRIPCTRCFATPEPWGEAKIEMPGWKLTHNPMAWGSQTPRILVLGFSKGTHQNEDILRRRHEDIPFRGGRHNLTAILQSLKLLRDDEKVDQRFASTEQDFAFGSLLRCSIAMEHRGEWIMSGSDIITRAANHPVVRPWFDNCAKQFSGSFPDRLRLVVMLGNQMEYVAACHKIFSGIHPGIQLVNDVAYRTEKVLWVHTVHFKAQGRLVPQWCGKHGNCKQFHKGEFARDAVRQIGLCH